MGAMRSWKDTPVFVALNRSHSTKTVSITEHRCNAVRFSNLGPVFFLSFSISSPYGIEVGITGGDITTQKLSFWIKRTRPQLRPLKLKLAEK